MERLHDKVLHASLGRVSSDFTLWGAVAGCSLDLRRTTSRGQSTSFSPLLDFLSFVISGFVSWTDLAPRKGAPCEGSWFQFLGQEHSRTLHNPAVELLERNACFMWKCLMRGEQLMGGGWGSVPRLTWREWWLVCGGWESWWCSAHPDSSAARSAHDKHTLMS